VLQQACRQAAQWHGQGLGDLVVAVNLSAVQFRRGNLEAVVQRALADSALPPQLLELELTESILIKNTDSILATVRRFKAMGIKLSIDDFGTGYSSLAYLKRFAVDKLKIDQSFIRDLSSDTGNAAIVQAIIQMARSLGLKTIAEGVEEGALLDYLQDSRCDEAQGYHIGRPMTAAAFVAFVRAHP
jgi:EAL domain-containing protein (putative c-di-GMP-specific phosphodiesterase class I)